MDSQEIKAFARTLHLDAVGIAPAQLPLPPHLFQQSPLCPLAAGQGQERYEPRRLLASCQSVIVVLFPYYTGAEQGGNVSLYCRSLDYHTIVGSYLNRIAAYIQAKEPQSKQYCIIDTSPLDDRWLAYTAGLGFFGDNHCFIHEVYGSYCFIGSILTSLPLSPDTPLTRDCGHCKRCAASCPGHCFDGGTYDYSRCKSFLTQKKGSLTLPEISIVKRTPVIFGCDECQRVCPHNQHVPLTPLPEFHQNRLLTVTSPDIDTLSNRQFQQAYGSRAFAWRGKKILLRNLAYVTEPLQARNEIHDGNGDVQEKQDNTSRQDDDGQNNS